MPTDPKTALDFLEAYAVRAIKGQDVTAESQFFVQVRNFLGSNPEAVAVANFKAAAAENADRWVPANGGYETPLTYRTGRRLLYVFNPARGGHAYLDLNADRILTSDEALAAIGN